MKFGKLLKETTEGMGPEMHDLFVRYKELKKYLKAMKKQKQQLGAETVAAAHAAKDVSELQEASTSGNQDQALENVLSAEEKAFVDMLNEDLLRFNRFFIDREEDSVIKLQALSDRIRTASGTEELQALKAELVDFHGEMVLLLHWSLLNYAAVVKILKKHDKCSGLLLRAPYLANVLQQPFYSTSVMSRLVKMAEEHINALVAKQQQSQQDTSDTAAGPAVATTSTPPPTETASKHAAAVTVQATAQETGAAAAADGAGAADQDDSSSLDEDCSLPVDTAVFARTRMALQTWDQLCTTASTPSTVLPPSSTELVRQLRVRERWAKLVGVPPGGQQLGQPVSEQVAEQPDQQQVTQQHVVQPSAAGAAAEAAVQPSAAGAGVSPLGEAAAQDMKGQHEPPEVDDETAAKRRRC